MQMAIQNKIEIQQDYQLQADLEILESIFGPIGNTKDFSIVTQHSDSQFILFKSLGNPGPEDVGWFKNFHR